MTTKHDHDQDGTGIERPTIMRNVIRQPQNNEAGFGIAHVDNAPPNETKYRIEQLWPSGEAQPVYIGDENDALELAEELIRVVRRE